ncbi:hypothetical protein [Actinomadura kijaniata]|uniref:hypothetical protein n=1 Tax=Actinomadura kijaniata TaxID=46161 RepID=UPI000835F234|nr:hypothetical protein [Actinomadura kijaniata]
MTSPGSDRPVAHEAIELVASQQQLTDSSADVDYDMLAQIDELPEEQAVALIDDVMGQILFD